MTGPFPFASIQSLCVAVVRDVVVVIAPVACGLVHGVVVVASGWGACSWVVVSAPPVSPDSVVSASVPSATVVVGTALLRGAFETDGVDGNDADETCGGVTVREEIDDPPSPPLLHAARVTAAPTASAARSRWVLVMRLA